jgi:hypothetical protein
MARYLLFLLCALAPLLAQAQVKTSKTANAGVIPKLGSDLKISCKRFQLMQQELKTKKPIGQTELVDGASCLNFIAGVVSTVTTLDVGFYPDLKYTIAKPSTTHVEMVGLFMDYISSHPEIESGSSVEVLVLALMEKGVLAPAQWTAKK